ncbi:hypothetical protein J5277_16845 [Rhizobium sp. 16-449-1b]|nr:hypothetical protein [Rhizobium sp. 16-449-1b]
MTFLSPFNVRSPVFFMEVSEARHEIKYFGIRRVPTGVIVLGRLNDDVDHIRETATATAAFFHGVVDFRRDNKLPTVLIEKAVDNLPDFGVGYVVATADKHVFIPNMTMTIVFLLKKTLVVKKDSYSGTPASPAFRLIYDPIEADGSPLATMSDRTRC